MDSGVAEVNYEGPCLRKESELNRSLRGCSSSASLVALLELQPAENFVGQSNTLLAPESLPATFRTPTAFCPPDQRCRSSVTLGRRHHDFINPERVAAGTRCLSSAGEMFIVRE